MKTLIVLVMLTSTAAAADVCVAPGGSIQAAIDIAVSGDRVLVPPGTYFEAIDFSGKAIEVIGVEGATSTVIDATALATSVVTFHSGEGRDSILRGFTITGGLVTSGIAGAGISAVSFASGSTRPTIRDCVVRFNQVSGLGGTGGGVAGDVLLERCAIYDNFATFVGGGVWGSPTMRRCVVANNHAETGGGIYLGAGASLIEECQVVDNVGGGIAGGVFDFILETKLILRRSVVAGNSSVCSGFCGPGGLFVASGVHALFPEVLIKSCTIVGNGGFPAGPGVSSGGEMLNSIVRSNIPPQIAGSVSVAWSNVQGGSPGLGNFDVDPSFVDGVARDLHLRSGSACIDAGNPATFDADGSRADVGAYALQGFYVRDNAAPDAWLLPAWPASSSTGGSAAYRIFADVAQAGAPYIVLGSATGASAGAPHLGTALPLVIDAFTAFTFLHAGPPLYVGQAGVLDDNGGAEMVITLPPGLSPTSTVRFWHAAVLFDPVTLSPTLATNAASIVLSP